MFKLRGCPKCHGDLYSGRDIYGPFFSCVQCGRYFEAAGVPVRSEEKAESVPDAGPPLLADLDLAA